MSSKRSRNKPASARPSAQRASSQSRSAQSRSVQGGSVQRTTPGRGSAARVAPGAGQAPEERPGNPNLLLGVTVTVAVLLGLYYHVLALRQMQELVGLPMLDHHLLYGASTVDTLRAAMTGDDLGQLSWVHKTAGLLFALVTALATSLSVGLHAPRRPWRRLLYVAPLAFVVVSLAQNIVVDRLLGRPGDGTVALASTLTLITWLLLAACAVTTAWVLIAAFVREFRRRWDDPSLQS